MADNQKKDNFFKRAAKAIATYAKATKSEVKKISWPTRKQLVNNTAIVIVCICIVGVMIFILDSVFGFGFNFLNNKKLVSDAEPIEISTDIYEDATDYVLDDMVDVEYSSDIAE
ncbi:MAG: preprotein translocase subunit SecE [Clostridia bacterium]